MLTAQFIIVRKHVFLNYLSCIRGCPRIATSRITKVRFFLLTADGLEQGIVFSIQGLTDGLFYMFLVPLPAKLTLLQQLPDLPVGRINFKTVTQLRAGMFESDISIETRRMCI
jgi:hypothetical protein